MRWSLPVFCLSAIAPGALYADDGKLQQARSESLFSTAAASTVRSESSSENGSCDLEGESLDRETVSFLGALFYYTVISPFAIPHTFLHDDFSIPSSFLPYPYAQDSPGAMLRVSRPFADADPEPCDRLWTIRVAVEEGNDLDGLNRLGVSYLADTALR
jgi:hypothetical protein